MRLLPPSASGILSYFTRHGTAANLILVVMLVLGVAASTQIRSQFFPDVVIDNVTVSMRWDGAGPEDVDDGIVALLEPALLGVEGIESTASTASEGRAVIRLNFQPDWDMARAADDVKIAVDDLMQLLGCLRVLMRLMLEGVLGVIVLQTLSYLALFLQINCLVLRMN